MTDTTAQEPTMEEILASIRRIISEDDAPAETAEAVSDPEPLAAAEPVEAAPAYTPEPVAEAPAFEEPAAADEDVLELTDVYEAPLAAESIGDLEVFASEPEPAPAPTPAPAYDALVGESASASAASAFAGFASSLKKPEPVRAPTGDMAFLSGSTVEGMVAEMLKPMLKDWLDANLPGIVQTAVKAEVERIARSAT